MLDKGRDDFGLDTHFDALVYMSVVGLIPGLHRWLIGNARLLKFLNSFQAFRENNIALKVRDSNNPSKLSDRDIIDSLMINVFVGSDTTAFSLTACFYYLVKNP
ncbi:uncharacterized protein RHO25_008658 [Cercospora beticola]|uniref:Uncharacterized protein n=1 Tax=Cercospora beticola TaxID=122368 RepID=A0ABZ0NWQ6_CERBT|nr:hypothetical protein RHO25_008658 [Cercospora beticola]